MPLFCCRPLTVSFTVVVATTLRLNADVYTRVHEVAICKSLARLTNAFTVVPTCSKQQLLLSKPMLCPTSMTICCPVATTDGLCSQLHDEQLPSYTEHIERLPLSAVHNCVTLRHLLPSTTIPLMARGSYTIKAMRSLESGRGTRFSRKRVGVEGRGGWIAILANSQPDSGECFPRSRRNSGKSSIVGVDDDGRHIPGYCK